jgi:hypothetical protein
MHGKVLNIAALNLRRASVAKGANMKLKIALIGGLMLAGANAMAACYTVYDAGSRVVYQGPQAPVDMSIPLHEALAQRFSRSAQMVFDQNAVCRPVGIAQLPRPTSSDVPLNTIRLERTRNALPPGSSAPGPLFTDRQTAERAGLPHTQVAGDIVAVPPEVAERAMHASVTVLPATTFAAGGGIPDTTALGAGPARPAAASATRQAAGGKPTVVITELRDPPITIIDRGGNSTVTQY